MCMCCVYGGVCHTTMSDPFPSVLLSHVPKCLGLVDVTLNRKSPCTTYEIQILEPCKFTCNERAITPADLNNLSIWGKSTFFG